MLKSKSKMFWEKGLKYIDFEINKKQKTTFMLVVYYKMILDDIANRPDDLRCEITCACHGARLNGNRCVVD